MNDQKSLKKIIVAVIIIEIMIFISYYFVLSDIGKRVHNTSVIEAEISSQIEKQSNIFSMEGMVKNTESAMTEVDNSIIQKGEDVKFIENIEKIATAYNLAVKINSLSIQDSPALTSGKLTILNANSTVIGSWAGVYSFLTQIESIPFKIKINKMSLVNNSDQTTDNNASQKNSSKQWQGVFDISVLKYK